MGQDSAWRWAPYIMMAPVPRYGTEEWVGVIHFWKQALWPKEWNGSSPSLAMCLCYLRLRRVLYRNPADIAMISGL